MTSLKICIITSVLIFTFKTYGQVKQLNTNQSNLTWTGKSAYSSYTLNGSIEFKSGSIEIKNDTIKKLTITVDMNSINHKNPDLKKHLKSADFFEVKKFKNAYFELIIPSAIKDDKVVLKGNMTIKDVTKEEKIIINFKNSYKSISFETILDRTKYGVKFNSPNFFKELKEHAIADDFILKGELTFEN